MWNPLLLFTNQLKLENIDIERQVAHQRCNSTVQQFQV